MGMSGEEYDRYAGDYSPNKDRKLNEWRARREEERKKKMEDEARRDSLDEAEREEAKEMKGPAKPVTPMKGYPIIDSINNGVMGAPAVKPKRDRRKHFDTGHQPSLFDDVE